MPDFFTPLPRPPLIFISNSLSGEFTHISTRADVQENVQVSTLSSLFLLVSFLRSFLLSLFLSFFNVIRCCWQSHCALSVLFSHSVPVLPECY